MITNAKISKIKAKNLNENLIHNTERSLEETFQIREM